MEHVSPLFSASLGKYALRIQNPYLFIDCSIENGTYCSSILERWRVVTLLSQLIAFG